MRYLWYVGAALVIICAWLCIGALTWRVGSALMKRGRVISTEDEMLVLQLTVIFWPVFLLGGVVFVLGNGFIKVCKGVNRASLTPTKNWFGGALQTIAGAQDKRDPSRNSCVPR